MENNTKNIICCETKSRSRGDNWTQEEKDLFLEIMRQSTPIIENKQTDTNTNKRKNLEWLKVQNNLKELTGKTRDILQLKGFWRRTKVAAKKSVSVHRRALQATGGGQKPPSPPPDDVKIMEMCPTDFIIGENVYDSDAVPQLTGQVNDGNKVQDEIHNSTIYDIEVNEDTENEAEVSFVEEVVTIADVHFNEIDIKSIGDKRETKTKLIKPPKVEKMDKNPRKEKYHKNESSEAALIGTSIEIKKRAILQMEEEYALKIKYQQEELAHQQLRHKLELDVLMLEKEKKCWKLRF